MGRHIKTDSFPGAVLGFLPFTQGSQLRIHSLADKLNPAFVPLHSFTYT
jgi:hypothetical protein